MTRGQTTVDASDLRAALGRLSADLLFPEARADAATLARDALAEVAPVRTGRLRASATGTVTATGSSSWFTAPYAGYVDELRNLDERAVAKCAPAIVRAFERELDRAARRASG